MFEQDYIMRLISEMLRAILKLVFHIDFDKNEEIVFENEESKKAYDRLVKMLDGGKINEAENKLLDELDINNINDYQVAIMFYSYLNTKDNEFLEKNNYSRKEISDGIKLVSKMYDYAGIADVLLSDIED